MSCRHYYCGVQLNVPERIGKISEDLEWLGGTARYKKKKIAEAAMSTAKANWTKLLNGYKATRALANSDRLGGEKNRVNKSHDGRKDWHDVGASEQSLKLLARSTSDNGELVLANGVQKKSRAQL